MKDLMGMMQKAQELQAKMGEMQEQIKNIEATGSSGAGLVTVTLGGGGSLKGLKIDHSLMVDGDAEILEDLIIAAHADARGKVEAATNAKMQEVTAGMPLPPGMKLPF
jgi:hypothetical protein